MKYFAGSNSGFNKLGVRVKRFAVTFLVLICFAFMLLGKADVIIVDQTKVIAMEILTPVIKVVSIPVMKVADFFDNIAELAKIRKENAVLRKENLNLLKWQSAAHYLKFENERLAKLLKYKPLPNASYVAARVIAEKSGSYAKSLIAYVQSPEELTKGQAVVTEKGLVGRVDLKGKNSIRVLLITDINSRIPIITEETRTKAILAGNNTNYPQLTSIYENSEVKIGERVVTSDITGAFPAGIPVGVVVGATDDGLLKVKPFVDFSRLEYISIVVFNLTGILPEDISCLGRAK
ncbi:MAG: rod shape-determining protein MreC [Alphaproteobacteria bacterium]